MIGLQNGPLTPTFLKFHASLNHNKSLSCPHSSSVPLYMLTFCSGTLQSYFSSLFFCLKFKAILAPMSVSIHRASTKISFTLLKIVLNFTEISSIQINLQVLKKKDLNLLIKIANNYGNELFCPTPSVYYRSEYMFKYHCLPSCSV